MINCTNVDFQYEIKIGQIPIPRVNTTKLLGLHIDDRLRWNFHTKHVVDKVSKMCGILYTLRKKLTASAMRTLYMSLIYSHLIYCIPIWGNTWSCHLRPVELAQKRAVRTISGVSRYEHTHELFINLKLLKLNYVCMYFSSLLIFKFLNCEYVPSVFVRDNNPYVLRNINNVIVPYFRSETFMKSVYYRSPIIWYNLHPDLKQLTNINTFKFLVLFLLNLVQAPLPPPLIGRDGQCSSAQIF